MRCVRTRVLRESAPATDRSGPSPRVTASNWAGFSPARRPSADIATTLPGASDSPGSLRAGRTRRALITGAGVADRSKVRQLQLQVGTPRTPQRSARTGQDAMFFNIWVVVMVSLAVLTLLSHRPSWAARRNQVRVAVVVVVGVATAVAFASGQSMLFSIGLAAITLVTGAFVVGGYVKGSRASGHGP